ncbi:MAG: ATP-grasp domain-containing protein [Lachnospiraceae bacterium]|nr:ATP-grasp domain-containing protein [Lachnospiraceae bacterium]
MVEKNGIHKKNKILIGSNGGLTGIYLARKLKKLDNVILYGADSSDICTGKFFVDKQMYLPNAKEEKFIERLIDLFESEKIDIYLPTHSEEIKVIAMNEFEIRKLSKVEFVVSPYETFEALNDKLAANFSLHQVGIPVPKLIEGLSKDYPILMKSREGSGSRGVTLIENSAIHKAYLDTCVDRVFFQLIHGKEYTADCLFDKEGNLVGFNQRQRLKTIGGAVTVSQNDYCFNIEPWIRKIAGSWIFRGCVNFQYIVENGIPYFIDINLRYPSGGLPLTVQSGFDIPKLVVQLLLDEPIVFEYGKFKSSEIKMYRYYEEIFEE